jgi:hypothetical protein
LRIVGRIKANIYELAAAGVIALLVLAQVWFVYQDTRVIWDPGRYLIKVPEYYWSFESASTAFAALPSALVDSSGWYQWGVAASMRIFGRDPWVFEGWAVGWFAMTLISSAVLARRLAGGAAALAAVGLVGSVPSVTVFARTAWIHIPEAALLMTALAIYVNDLRLERKATVVWMILLGALTIQLRESGLIWVATMGPMILYGTWRLGGPIPWKRVALVGISWMIAVIPPMIRMVEYLEAKLGARERYLLQTPPLKEQFVESLSLPVAILCLVGGIFLLIELRRRFHPVGALLLSWALVPILLFMIFYAGFTNYTPYMTAICVAAACGLTWIDGSIALVPILVLSVVFQAWWPEPLLEEAVEGMDLGRTELRKRMRPVAGWGGTDVVALLDASCKEERWHSCRVVVDQGLFYPASEEYGFFELFLLGEDRVELRTLYDDPELGWEGYEIDALVLFRCGEQDEGYLRRAPDAIRRGLKMIEDQNLEVVYSDKVDDYCSYYWFTALGWNAESELLPVPWKPDEVEEWSLEIERERDLAFQERNPDFANRPGHAVAYADDIEIWNKSPDGWVAEEMVQVRERARTGLRLASERAREIRAEAEPEEAGGEELSRAE